MGSFKLLSHHHQANTDSLEDDEVTVTEDELKKIYDKYADLEFDTVSSDALSKILAELGCYPELKEHEMKVLQTQITGSNDEDPDIDFMSFWMWWVKSEPNKKR